MSFIDGLNKLLGDPNERELKKYRALVPAIRAAQATAPLQALTLATLPQQTAALKKQLEAGKTVDDILPEAFATVVRACELLQGNTIQIETQTYTWNMVPYDVQLIGGMVLHFGQIAEMKTGEGKTLVSTLPVYLNALTGKGVHIVTVNDYLAKRDAAWMGMLYTALGLTVGVVIHEVEPHERKAAYACDITYGTNNEFGFDYLRDNMVSSIDRQVQRGLQYAIVDEVDSILIDEARTPLIISQPAGESNVKYQQYSMLVSELKENVHFNRDEKQKVATLSEEGIKKMEELLGIQNIYTERGFEEVHHIEQALRALAMYELDTDYVVRDGEVIIVDEFTGRLMPGRRYGHGLHQAIEAKEKVEVQRESKTLATITFQNYFRLYQKLAGMTGTAKTEEEEFESIYKLRTVVIPTNKPIARKDLPDAIYRTTLAKFTAVAKIAKQKHATGQPILIGTTSIEKSEALSTLLQREGVPHQVLNAKNHTKEAGIIAEAGQRHSVTIATNMAGRGTDIQLGKDVAALGGLCVIGTERHESRRIDNQLRGRSGRQGDLGETQFFVSMEDELMRLFGGDRIKSMMERLKVPDDVPLNNSIISRSIEGAQKRVEGRNFDIRRHVVQYDDVMNKHRTIMYTRRQQILVKLAEAVQDAAADNPLHADVLSYLQKEARALAVTHAADRDSDNWNATEILETLATLHPQLTQELTVESIRAYEQTAALQQHLEDRLVGFYETKCEQFDSKAVVQAERIVTLRSIDTHWMDHIDDMAHLREQVAFAGYAQRDPLIEYKDQGFQRFRALLNTIETSIIRTLLQVDLNQFVPAVFLQRSEAELDNVQTNEQEIAKELEQTGVHSSPDAQANSQNRSARRRDENVQTMPITPAGRPMPDSLSKFLPGKKKR